MDLLAKLRVEQKIAKKKGWVKSNGAWKPTFELDPNDVSFAGLGTRRRKDAPPADANVQLMQLRVQAREAGWERVRKAVDGAA